MKTLVLIAAAGTLLAAQTSPAEQTIAANASTAAADKAKLSMGQPANKPTPKPIIKPGAADAVKAAGQQAQGGQAKADNRAKEAGSGFSGNAALVTDLQKAMDKGDSAAAASEKKLPSIYDANYPTIYPEVTTSVEISSSDVNRFTCLNGSIRDVAHSEEKGILVKFTGKDVFVKFAVKQSGDNINYATMPAEFFVVCDEDVYNMVLVPKRIPAQVVKLGATQRDRVKKNLSIFASQPFEKKISNLVRMVYSDDLADSFTVERFETDIPLFRDVIITHTRSVTVDGEGLRAKEYRVEVKKGSKPVIIDEKDFLRRDMTEKPVAVSIDKMKLQPGQAARLIIVEHLKEKGDK